MTEPVVSVVIPTYDRPALLRRAVASAVTQERVSVEVVVIDNGARMAVDPTTLPDGVVVQTASTGDVAGARNLGVETSTADRIAFLDDDDVWAPDHLHHVLTAMTAASADFGYSATWSVDLFGDRAVRRPAPPAAGVDRLLLRENVIGTPSCVVVDRALLQAVGGFDPRFAIVADWELWIRLANAGVAVDSPAPTVAYCTHEGNMSLDLERLLEEFGRLSASYGPLARRHGLSFGDPGFPRWVAHLHRRQGHRSAAAAWYARSARRPGQRSDAIRALGMLLGERAMRIGATGPRAAGGRAPAWVKDALGRPGPRIPV